MGAGGDIPSGNLPKPLLSPLCFQPLLCPVAVGSTGCTGTMTKSALLGLKQMPAHFTGCSLDLEQRERTKVRSFNSCCEQLTQAQPRVVFPSPPCLPQAEEPYRVQSPDTEASHLAVMLQTTSLTAAFLSRLSEQNFTQFPRYFDITLSLKKTLRTVLDFIPNDSVYSV